MEVCLLSVHVKIPMVLLQVLAFMCIALSSSPAYSNPPLFDIDSLSEEVYMEMEMEILDKQEIDDFNKNNKFLRLVYAKISEGHYVYVIFAKKEYEDMVLDSKLQLKSSLAEKLILAENVPVSEKVKVFNADYFNLAEHLELAGETAMGTRGFEHVYGLDGIETEKLVPVHIESVKSHKNAMDNINRFSKVIIRHILDAETHLLKNMTNISTKANLIEQTKILSFRIGIAASVWSHSVFFGGSLDGVSNPMATFRTLLFTTAAYNFVYVFLSKHVQKAATGFKDGVVRGYKKINPSYEGNHIFETTLKMTAVFIPNMLILMTYNAAADLPILTSKTIFTALWITAYSEPWLVLLSDVREKIEEKLERLKLTKEELKNTHFFKETQNVDRLHRFGQVFFSLVSPVIYLANVPGADVSLQILAASLSVPLALYGNYLIYSGHGLEKFGRHYTWAKEKTQNFLLDVNNRKVLIRKQVWERAYRMGLISEKRYLIFYDIYPNVVERVERNVFMEDIGLSTEPGGRVAKKCSLFFGR